MVLCILYMTTFHKIYEVVSKIPRGSVATYGQIAILSGVNSPRVVGSILHKNPDPKLTPCYRVVTSNGKLAEKYAFGGIYQQKKKLQNDGIDVVKNTVDVKKYLWKIH